MSWPAALAGFVTKGKQLGLAKTFERGDRVRHEEYDTDTVIHFHGETDDQGRKYRATPHEVWVTFDGNGRIRVGEYWCEVDKLTKI